MANFKTAALATLESEGGYSNRPEADHGGETYMGISRRWHADWEGWPIIDAIKAKRPLQQGEVGLLDVELVLKRYRQVFWDPLRADELQDQGIANQLFDHAITAGPGDAVKLLQVACGASVDGKIGPKTLEAANNASRADRYALRRRLFSLRVAYYLEESKKSLTQHANLPSWIRRTVKCYSGEI